MNDGTILLNRKMYLGVLSDDGRFFAMFVVYGTGCNSIHLRASVLGQATAATLEKTVPFRCGE